MIVKCNVLAANTSQEPNVELSTKDKTILRDVGRKLAEVAAHPSHKEKAGLWRRLNGLERVRPMILLMDSTQHETGNKVELQCEGKWARAEERALRTKIYQWEHMRDDRVIDATSYCSFIYTVTGMGIEVNTTNPDHVFGAKQYNCVIDDNSDPEMIRMPEVTVDWNATNRRLDLFHEVYDGIIPVGAHGNAGCWFAIMDGFIQWRGLQRTFIDMIDRPEWVHAWMEQLTRWHESEWEQYEELGLISLNNCTDGVMSVGPGGLGFTDELPQPDFDGEHIRRKDIWGHATTQIFSEVSPAMHEEFALKYERRFLSKFGLSSYGCCEPLDRKVNILRSIPNLRRISMSPWIDAARGAEAIGRDGVFSYKPNPAILGMETWDVNYAREQLRDVFEKTKGCVVEVIMKDLHTVRGEVRRMSEWVDMAMQLAQEYA